MNTEDVIRVAAQHIDNELVITNIGLISKILFNIKDREKNFYMTGSMGQCSSIGLGLSISVEDFVTCFEGDGSLLMNLNIISTLAKYKPDNLCIFLIDNGVFETTGGQKTYLRNIFNFSEMLKSIFLNNYYLITSKNELNNFLNKTYKTKGFKLAHIFVGVTEKVYPIIPMKCTSIKERFVQAIK